MSTEAQHNSAESQQTKKVSVNEAQSAVYPDRAPIPKPNRGRMMGIMGALAGGLLLGGYGAGEVVDRMANRGDTQNNRTDDQNNQDPDVVAGGEAPDPASTDIPTGNEQSIDVTPQPSSPEAPASAETNNSGFPAGFINPETGEIDHQAAASIRINEKNPDGSLKTFDQIISEFNGAYEDFLHIGIPATNESQARYSVPEEEQINSTIVAGLFADSVEGFPLGYAGNLLRDAQAGHEQVIEIADIVRANSLVTSKSIQGESLVNEPVYHAKTEITVGPEYNGNSTISEDVPMYEFLGEISIKDNLDQKPEGAAYGEYLNNYPMESIDVKAPVALAFFRANDGSGVLIPKINIVDVNGENVTVATELPVEH